MPPPSVPLDAIRQPAMLFNTCGRIVAANAAAETLAGRPLVGLADTEALHIFNYRRPDGIPLVPGDLPSARARADGNGETVEVPLIITAADGRRLEIVATASPVLDEGAVTGVLVVWRDVTQQRRAEAALLRSEEESRHIVEYAPTGIYEIDYAGPRFRRVNDAICRILGYSAEELLAMDPFALLDNEGCERLRERLRQIHEGEPVGASVAFRVTARDGRQIVAALNVTPTYTDGVVDGSLVVAHDVTEREQAATALRESEERFRTILDNPLDALYRRNLLTGRFDYFSAAIERIIGFPVDEVLTWSAETILGRLHLDDRPAVLSDKMNLPDGASEGAVDYRFLRRDGTWVWLSDRFRITRDATGRPLARDGIVRDITEQRRAEEALRESEERFRTAFENVPLGMGLGDPDGRVLGCNVALEEMLGYGTDELIGRSFTEFTYPGELATERSLMESVLAGESDRYEIEKRYVRRDGRIILVRLIAGLIRDAEGAPRAWIAVHDDITDRRRAEEALRESEQRLTLAQQAGGVGVYDWDLATGEIVWTPEIERIYGIPSPSDPLKRRDVWIRHVHPDDRDPLLTKMQQWLASGNSEGAWEYRYIRPDGGERWLAGSSMVVRDAAGRPLRVIGTNIDITERKRAEEALREYAENLRRSNEDLERFAYVASHDLQEPLRTIVSFSQLLERRYKGQLDQDADEYIDFIVEGGTRMQTLILDLLAYSRVNTRPQELRPTDVEEVMASVERNILSQGRDSGATLTYDEMPVVTADPLQLEQVFSNLVNNAIKFRRPDEPLRIRVSAQRRDGFWEFSVRDNGIGIALEYFDRIFVIFQRLHTADTYPGTGIGLAIVKRIVERHGGTVRVESTPGEGSTFFFTLPVLTGY